MIMIWAGPSAAYLHVNVSIACSVCPIFISSRGIEEINVSF